MNRSSASARLAASGVARIASYAFCWATGSPGTCANTGAIRGANTPPLTTRSTNDMIAPYRRNAAIIFFSLTTSERSRMITESGKFRDRFVGIRQCLPEVERGRGDDDQTFDNGSADRAAGHRIWHFRERPAGGTAAGRTGPGRRGQAALRAARIHRDRKSTRLNSSHANISYAV